GPGEPAVLRALGVDTRHGVAVATIAAVLVVGLGLLSAIAIAVALSPLAPLGVVRDVEPNRGVSFDWTVLFSCTAVLAVMLIATTAAVAFRSNRRLGSPRRASVAAESAAVGGIGPAAVVGGGAALSRTRQGACRAVRWKRGSGRTTSGPSPSRMAAMARSGPAGKPSSCKASGGRPSRPSVAPTRSGPVSAKGSPWPAGA